MFVETGRFQIICTKTEFLYTFLWNIATLFELL